MTDIDRAPFLWIGGKGRMKSYLLPLIPYTKYYVEPFGGAANMLFARTPVEREVYNDYDWRLFNLFATLADKRKFPHLKRRLEQTLYSKREFLRANYILENIEHMTKAPNVNAAWGFFVSQNQGFSGRGSTWGRSITESSGGCNITVARWESRIRLLDVWHKRLRNVSCYNRDAMQLLKKYDAADTTFYLDPPYVLETRTKSVCYTSELPLEYHEKMVKIILQLQGAVVLSGYFHPVYEPLVSAGWSLSRRVTSCSAAGRTRNSGLQGKGAVISSQTRVEGVWRNKRAQALCAGSGGLFDNLSEPSRGPF
jgi:DNA adenine methylase